MPASSSAGPCFPGTVLGPYVVDRLLGSGAFADVYLARHSILDQLVALKIIRSSSADAREQDGARLMCRLRHPNIVSVQFADRIAGRLVIAMEYVDGPTLRQVIDDQAPLTLARATQVLVAVCDALQYLHTLPQTDGRPVAHLDLKPCNILIAQDGTPRITDFGIASLTRQETGSAVAGSPSYMAPEQFAGHPSTQSDIWAIGVLLYEMLTGQRPAAGTPVDLSRLPSGAASIVERCLRTDPTERFKSAAELKDALAHAVGGSPAACPRCGAALEDGHAECPECTIAQAQPAALKRFVGAPRADERQSRKRSRGRWAAALLVALAAASGATIVGAVAYRRQTHEEARTMALRTARQQEAQRAFRDVVALERSTAGSYRDRIDALKAFLAAYGESPDARTAADDLDVWTREAGSYEQADAYERAKDFRLSDALTRWQTFAERQQTGFRRLSAEGRIRDLEGRLAAWSGYARLTVVGASGLAALQTGLLPHAVPSPYFVLRRNGEFVYRSLTVVKSPAPAWNESARVSVRPGTVFTLEIWDRRVFADDLLVRQSVERLPRDGPFTVARSTVQMQLDIRREP